MTRFLCLAFFLGGIALASAQPAVPATPADPSQARPAIPVTPDAITPAAPVLSNTPAAAQPQAAVSVIADTSLKQVLAALAQSWADTQANGPQVPISLTNAGTLRSKVESGPAFDVVISADLADAKALTDKGILLADGQRTLARNTLVIYGRKALLKEDDLDWYDLIGTEWKKIALGSSDVTVSGRVANRALQKHDLLGDDKKDLYVFKPTDTLAADQVQRDAADAVFLFKTDAARLTLHGFEIVPLSTDDAPPIFYTAAVSRLAKNPTQARALIDYCGSAEAKAVWAKFGFETN